jgi:hypothetical protein
MRGLHHRWMQLELLILVLLPAATNGQVWQAGGCSAALEPELQAYEQSVRSAKPDASIYAPKPFPKTEDQVDRSAGSQ